MMVMVVATVVLLANARNVVPEQTPDPSQALRNRVQAFQTAWNAHDGAAVAAFFTDDADQIMGDGPTTRGLPALQQWWRDRFTIMEPGRRITLTVSSLRLAGPDVGVIDTLAATGGSSAPGQELSTSTDRGTWVVVQRGGQWLIAALRVYPAAKVTPR
jgi:uncharacterized protein (TIGR02246 family)